MGSGKSTIGKRLSKLYHLSFVDVDHYIEQKHDKKIVNIFAKGGEKLFRRLEHEALKDVVHKQVVATGGGIVERKENIQLMKAYGKIIYLHTSFSEIDNRLKSDTSRPLWMNSTPSEKEQLYNKRHKLYKSVADQSVTTDQRTVEQVCTKIAHIFNLSRQ